MLTAESGGWIYSHVYQSWRRLSPFVSGKSSRGTHINHSSLSPRDCKGSMCPVCCLCTWPAGWSLSLICGQWSTSRQLNLIEHYQLLNFGYPGFWLNLVILPISDYMTYKNDNFIWLNLCIKESKESKTLYSPTKSKTAISFKDISQTNPI